MVRTIFRNVLWLTYRLPIAVVQMVEHLRLTSESLSRKMAL